jgi:radical SAM protein with 4Fe4S-binding SPASM domain
MDILNKKPSVGEKIFQDVRNGKVLLLDPEQPNWVVISEPLSEIILSCNGTKSVQNIVNEVSKKYNKDYSEKIISCFQKLYKLNFFIDANVKISEQSKTLDCLYFNLTKKCNLKCVYCYANAGSINLNESTLNFWKNLVDQFSEYNPNGKVVLTGGEPTLVNYFWDIVEYIKSKKLKITLITNGTIIKSSDILKCKDCFDEIEISIDSLTEKINKLTRDENSSIKTINFINALIQNGIKPTIMIVVTKSNKDYLNEFVKEYKESANLRFQPLYKMGRGKNLDNISITGDEYYNIFESQNIRSMKHDIVYKRNTKHFWCGMGKNVLSIESNGIVYPCQLMHNDSFQLGDLKKESLYEIWNNSPYKNNNIDMIEGCKECEVKYICSAPCRARAFYTSGNIYAKDPLCPDFIKRSIFDNLHEK